MIIRSETPADFEAIRKINIESFADHPYSHQTEHLIVEALREAGALTLSLVAEDKGEVIGHIAFSRAWIDTVDMGWFMLGPVAVLPPHQRRGIGSRLVEEGLEKLRRLGAKGCALVGNPAFYNRFGFRSGSGLNVYGVPPEFLLCLSLVGEIPSGCLTYHEAFNVTA